VLLGIWYEYPDVVRVSTVIIQNHHHITVIISTYHLGAVVEKLSWPKFFNY